MQFLPVFFILGLFLLCHGLPLDNTIADPDSETEPESEETLTREKRTIFPFVIGETILDIQCRRGYITVCAPDGPDGCPVGYLSATNVGVCGFATLNHFLNTTNIAGTCCYKLPGSSGSASGSATTTTAKSIVLPQIVAYPVYAQYPYSVGGSSYGSSGSGSGSGSSYSMGSGSGSGSSSSYGKK